MANQLLTSSPTRMGQSVTDIQLTPHMFIVFLLYNCQSACHSAKHLYAESERTALPCNVQTRSILTPSCAIIGQRSVATVGRPQGVSAFMLRHSLFCHSLFCFCFNETFGIFSPTIVFSPPRNRSQLEVAVSNIQCPVASVQLIKSGRVSSVP